MLICSPLKKNETGVEIFKHLKRDTWFGSLIVDVTFEHRGVISDKFGGKEKCPSPLQTTALLNR